MKDRIRIGAGAAHEADDLEAARTLAEEAALDHLVFDGQSEVALAKAYARLESGLPGYDVLLERKIRAVLPGCIRHGTRIITNGGILDSTGAAKLVQRLRHELGHPEVKIAWVGGGEVSDALRRRDPHIPDLGELFSSLGNDFGGAVAYGGAREIVEALRDGADIVITPRAGDAAQYLAPMFHDFGWADEDWERLGRGLGARAPPRVLGAGLGWLLCRSRGGHASARLRPNANAPSHATRKVAKADIRQHSLAARGSDMPSESVGGVLLATRAKAVALGGAARMPGHAAAA